MMSSENQASSGEWDHSALQPNGLSFTRTDSAEMRASVGHLDAVADLLALCATTISNQPKVSPSGGDPVSAQSARAFRAVVLNQLTTLQAEEATFRELAEMVRTQVTRVEQTEHESRARFTEESS